MKAFRHLLVLCTLWHSVAFAQSDAPDAEAEAGQHFGRGVELFQEQAYRASLVEFQRAYELAPDYRVLYNIGQAKLAVQDFLGAARSYEGYLREGGSAIPVERVQQIKEALTALRERVGSISVSVNRDHAEVFLDDEKIGESPILTPISANVGHHRISARTADGVTDAHGVDVAGGEIAMVSLKLVAPVARTIVVREADQPWSTLRKAALVNWSLGAALLVGGAITGPLALGAQRDLDKLVSTADVRRSTVQDKRSSVRTLAITTDVLVATGAAAAVTGTLLWLLDSPEEKKTSETRKALSKVRLDVGLSALSVRGQF